MTIELALAKDVLHTGAMDESEVVWTKLPYHRAALRWREMRKIVPRSMDMREVRRLFGEAFTVVEQGSGDGTLARSCIRESVWDCAPMGGDLHGNSGSRALFACAVIYVRFCMMHVLCFPYP